MTERVDVVVAGAGVIGLAIARALAQDGREVLVLDAAEAIGTGVSSRNSEVIHAGLYYPYGSLKAVLCVQGREMLYTYCKERGIAHSRLGKLVVATTKAEFGVLAGIQAKAAANGVETTLLSAAEACAMEPNLACTGALLSPSTGIIDSHGLMLSLQGEAEAAGTVCVFHAPILGGTVDGNGGVRLEVGGSEPMTLDCALFVNAAGLHAPALAAGIGGLPPSSVPQGYLCKGSYYGLASRAPFSRLIYPVPEAAGLGVHLTLDLGGQARFGPDTEWVDTEQYDVDISRAAGFYSAIRRYWPGLPDDALVPGYSGIRPKISAPGAPNLDFRISGTAEHGIGGYIGLYGIESPGLTASLAIGAYVQGLATRRNIPA